MTRSVCPTCHNRFTDINRHWQRSWSCNPLNKKPSDPFLAVHHDLQQQQQRTNVDFRKTDKGNNEAVNTVTTEAGLLDDFPLPGNDTDTNDEDPSAIRRSKRPKKKTRSNNTTTITTVRNQQILARVVARKKEASKIRFSSRLDDYMTEYLHQASIAPVTNHPLPATRFLSETSSEDDASEGIGNPWLFVHTEEFTPDFDNKEDDCRSVETSSHLATAPTPPGLDPEHTTEQTVQEHVTSQDVYFPIDLQDSFGLVASNCDRSMAELYSVADKCGSPRGLVDDLIGKMKQEAHLRQFSPLDPGITQRDAFFRRVSKHADYRPPQPIVVSLESGQRVTVHRHDYIEDLKELLVSSVYSDLSNIRCDPRDPFSNEPPSRTGVPSQQEPHLLDYSWYSDTYHKVFLPSMTCGNQVDKLENVHLFVPCGYTDATSRSLRSIEPVTLVDGRLTDEAKRDRANWIVLGYMPNIEKMSAAMRKTFGARGCASDIMARDYHRCMHVLLSPLLAFAQSKPIIPIRRGSMIRRMKIVTEFALWSLDNKAADMISAKLASKGPRSTRISRRCLCDFESAGLAHHQCFPVDGPVIDSLSQSALGPVYGLYNVDQRLPEIDNPGVRKILHARHGRTMEDVITAGDVVLNLPSIPLSDNCEYWLNFVQEKGGDNKTKRQSIARCRLLRQECASLVVKKIMGAKVVDNPLSLFSYGANKNGIHAATTADILHVLKNGIFPKFTEVVYHFMSPSQLASIDIHVERLFCRGHNRSTMRGRFPRVSFKKGYTKLTELRGFERVGQLYVMALLLRTPRGRDLISPRISDDFDRKRQELSQRARKKNKHQGKNSFSSKVDYSTSDSSRSEGDSSEEEEGDPLEGVEASGQGRVVLVDKDEYDTLNDLELWSIKRCLLYLHLPLVQDLRSEGALPPETHRRLEAVLTDFFSTRTVKQLMRAQLSIGELPAGQRMDYRTIPCQVKVTTKEERETEKKQFLEAFPPSSVSFDVVESRRGNSIGLDIDELSYVVETLLSFWAFVEYAPINCMTPARVALASQMLELLRQVLVKGVDRGEATHGWSFQKFIEMYHLIIETPIYGRGSSKDTNVTENLLKGWAVRPAKTAQKREDSIFTGQISLRHAEEKVMDRILRSNRIQESRRMPRVNSDLYPGEIQAEVAEIKKKDMTARGLYRLEIEEGGSFQYLPKRLPFEIDPEVTLFLINNHGCEEGDVVVTISLYTEICLEDGQLVRAHPNYNGGGCWYDTFILDGRPAKIVAIYKDPDLEGDLPSHILVQPAFNQTQLERENSSQLFEQWRWRSKETNEGGLYGPRLLSVEIQGTIKDLVYCIDLCPSRASLSRQRKEDFGFLRGLDPRIDWPLAFLNSQLHLSKKMK